MKQEAGRVDFTTKQTTFLTASFWAVNKFKNRKRILYRIPKSLWKAYGLHGKVHLWPQVNCIFYRSVCLKIGITRKPSVNNSEFALKCFSLHKDTTPPQPNHTVTPTHIEPEQYNTWNKSTKSRKLLKMVVLTFETCWAVNSEIIKQVTSSWSIFIQLSRWCTVQ